VADWFQRLADAGARPAGSWAFDALRVESLRPRVRVDTDERAIPHEVNWIGSAAHVAKGCYRGQETVSKVFNVGRPPRRMVLLHLDGSPEVLPETGDPVELGGRTVGRVGTVIQHHELGPIALALVKRSVPTEAELLTGVEDRVVQAAIDPDSEPPEHVGAGRETLERFKSRGSCGHPRDTGPSALAPRRPLEQDGAVIEVRIGGRRRIDRVLGPDFATDLDRLPLADLRQRRDEAAQEETDLSYLRCLLHARIDIVKAEQRRRRTGDESSLIDQLKNILADDSVGQRGRCQPLEPSRTTERSRRQIDALVSDAGLTDVGALSDEELDENLRRYTEQESTVSQFRREVQKVVDSINAEIAARYAQGTASVDQLLAEQRERD